MHMQVRQIRVGIFTNVGRPVSWIRFRWAVPGIRFDKTNKMNQNNEHQKKYLPVRRLVQHTMLVFIIVSQSSCFQHYYQTNTMEKPDFKNLEKLDTEKKYFIVHTDQAVFGLNKVIVDSFSISGNREIPDTNHNNNLNPKGTQSNRFPVLKEASVLSQVHIYTNKSFPGDGRVELTAEDITRVDVYSKDVRADKASKTRSIVGLAVTPVIVAGIVAIIAVSSGPLISGGSWNMHF